MAVVSTSDLVKNYGSIEALKGVSLNVDPGQIFGLLGQNGAGKSTMVKILLGIVKKSDGDATLLGEPAGTTDIRRKVGYLPEDHAFPGYHTGRSLMHFYGELYGMTRNERTKAMNDALDIVGLTKRADSKIKSFSKGMKQRLGIAQAFFHDPEVIFLDEPTDGVDPVGRKEIRDLLKTLKDEGRTIFVNSHLLGEVEMVSDRVAIIHQGEMVREGTVAELTEQKNKFTIGIEGSSTFPMDALQKLGYRVEVNKQYHDVEIEDGKSIDSVLAYLSENGLRLRHLVEHKTSLEDVFMGLVEKSDNASGTKRAARVARPVAARRVN